MAHCLSQEHILEEIGKYGAEHNMLTLLPFLEKFPDCLYYFVLYSS